MCSRKPVISSLVIYEQIGRMRSAFFFGLKCVNELGPKMPLSNSEHRALDSSDGEADSYVIMLTICTLTYLAASCS